MSTKRSHILKQTFLLPPDIKELMLRRLRVGYFSFRISPLFLIFALFDEDEVSTGIVL